MIESVGSRRNSIHKGPEARERQVSIKKWNRGKIWGQSTKAQSAVSWSSR